jgi:hypothetical protein
LFWREKKRLHDVVQTLAPHQRVCGSLLQNLDVAKLSVQEAEQQARALCVTLGVQTLEHRAKTLSDGPCGEIRMLLKAPVMHSCACWHGICW